MPRGAQTDQVEPDQSMTADTGVVVIGRNEGARLVRCLESIRPRVSTIVYVDSGSTDGSTAMARDLGVVVVELDMTTPFTAARARNVGFECLIKLAPSTNWVQFVDGDCELVDTWMGMARAFLREHPSGAFACGGLRERFPERSVYNRIADHGISARDETILACGGIFMARCSAFAAQQGFRDDLFVGEERELCRRLRKDGWQIWRLSQPMAWHDLNMMHFGQWWRRTKRTGFAYAQGVHLFSKDDPTVGKQVLRAICWAVVLPVVILAGLLLVGPPALVLVLLYPLQVLRTALSMTGPPRHRLLSAAFMTLGKFPEFLGQIQFWTSRQPIRHARSFDKT